ncbi:MAG: thiol:disulfide interchange protein DsbG [Methylophaga sp.]|jgi:thiol:disulfide interchange protein DsbG|uniref:thiol:disulfide interchange protein DsbG n=1 Tax=Methylophaga sp. TaxID=2024840 RepID=UPI000C0EF286|nr:thiol:disulfide interchange protein DsbG [Methylophaga sp.]MBL1459054.1 thiol:disulfide interchange protein DsbG [Methylophaga sp.]
MFAKRDICTLLILAPVMLMASCSQEENEEKIDRPPVLKAMEEQGLILMKEFDKDQNLRAFAGLVGDRPIAIYVMSNGNAVVGTRLNAKGEAIDEGILQNLVAKPVSDKAWAVLESATWVLDGKADAPRIVYTFTDANCPYCHLFWEAARPWVDSGKVQLRHILVGIIKEDSPAKAAAILGSSDQSAALQENEEKFDQGGIKPVEIISASVHKTLENNHLLMVSMGFRGTPGIVVRNDAGLVQKYKGMPQQNDLQEILGTN